MIPAKKWFGKTRPAEIVPAKDAPAANPPAAAPVVEPAAVAPAEPLKVEAAPAPAATSKPAAGPAGGLRASRLVDAGRRSSATLKSRLSTALAGAEPWGKPAVAAAAILVAGGLGFAGGLTSTGSGRGDDLSAARWGETASSIRENREDVARLASDMKTVRTALDGLKSERRAGDVSARQAQLSERVERSSTDTAGKIAKLADQLDRIEKTQRDPTRLGALVERLERIEKHLQTASLVPTAGSPAPAAVSAKPVAAAPSTAAADVAQTGSLPVDARPPVRPIEVDPRKLPAEGYTLRDIEDGFALVEGRNGRFFEVSPGMNLPGLGRVEAIERRGRQWVVVTPKGFVGER